jgi:hypothetical protein
MVGAVRGIDPETGFYFDDTKRYLYSVRSLTETDRTKIFEETARKVYPRITGTPALQSARPRQVAAAAASQGSTER